MCIDTTARDSHVALGVEAIIVAVDSDLTTSDVHHALALYAFAIGTCSSHAGAATADGDVAIGLDTLWRTGIVAVVAVVSIDILRA